MNFLKKLRFYYNLTKGLWKGRQMANEMEPLAKKVQNCDECHHGFCDEHREEYWEFVDERLDLGQNEL